MDATDTWEPQPGVPLPPVQKTKADAILAELVYERGAPTLEHYRRVIMVARHQGWPVLTTDPGRLQRIAPDLDIDLL